MENGHDNHSQTRGSSVFSQPYFAAEAIGWNPTISNNSQDLDSNDTASPQRVLTRRQRAALSVGRATGNETGHLSSMGSHLDFGSFYGLSSPLNPLSTPVTPSSNINLHLNPSANPADISPPTRRSHARHSSDAFSPRASSPASSIATSSSSIASLLSYSTSTWSSTTGESSPARSFGEPKSKHTKHKLRNSDRKDMCVFAEQFPDMKQEDIAVKYGVERSTVSKVLKNKAHWMSIEDEDVLKIIKHRPIKFPEVETAVLEWLHERNALGELISDTTLREQARAIARRLGIGEDQFKASGGWIENFKQRNKIRRGKFASERAERGVSVGVRRGSFSPGGELEEGGGSRTRGIRLLPGSNSHGFGAEDKYAQLYGTPAGSIGGGSSGGRGHFRPPKFGGSGVGGDDERESIASSAGSGSMYIDDDGGVAPMMAMFSLADKHPHSSSPSRPTMAPPSLLSHMNGSPRSSTNRSPPRMLTSPPRTHSNMPSPNSAAAGSATAGYSTRSKAAINAAQLQQSARMMSAFIREVYPEGFTESQREVWAVMERRTLEWARTQTHAQAHAQAQVQPLPQTQTSMQIQIQPQEQGPRAAVDTEMTGPSSTDAGLSEKGRVAGRTRGKGSSGVGLIP